MKLRDIAVLGMMVALLEAVKRALEFLPNVELVTLLLMIFALYFGPKTIIAAVAFTLVECFVWGINTWVIMYFYIWPAEILIVLLMQHFHKPKDASQYVIRYAFFAALFGLFFGAACAIPYLFIGGWSMAFTWWVAGIPFDIIHCVSNFLLCLILFKPLCIVARRAALIGTGA